MVGGVLGEQPVVLAPSPNNKTSQPSGAWAAGTGRRSIAFVAAGIQICGRRIVLFTSPTRLLRPRRSQIVSTPPAGHPGVSLPGPMDALPKPECARSSCSWRRTSMLSLCIGSPLRARATSPGCIMFPPPRRPAFSYHNGGCCHAPMAAQATARASRSVLVPAPNRDGVLVPLSSRKQRNCAACCPEHVLVPSRAQESWRWRPGCRPWRRPSRTGGDRIQFTVQGVDGK